MLEGRFALTRHLSGSRLDVAFKRLVPVDGHIVDFLAPTPIGQIVEVDGPWHHRGIALDEIVLPRAPTRQDLRNRMGLAGLLELACQLCENAC